VAEYRAYFVGRDGHFTGFEPLTCKDDAEAIEKAERLLDDDRDIDIWICARLVRKLEKKRR
jgi:hypothetical protein